jgi:hypothetical protein
MNHEVTKGTKRFSDWMSDLAGMKKDLTQRRKDKVIEISLRLCASA